uniref:Secreted protein n=1 Tax=Davidia involucrata TaxID=16924 RepID=A0A5B7AZE8_DAVIN
MWRLIHCCHHLFCLWVMILVVFNLTHQLKQPQSRKFQMRMFLKEMFNHLPCQSRIRRRRQGDVSLFTGCCCPPFLMTTYEECLSWLLQLCTSITQFTAKSPHDQRVCS